MIRNTQGKPLVVGSRQEAGIAPLRGMGMEVREGQIGWGRL